MLTRRSALSGLAAAAVAAPVMASTIVEKPFDPADFMKRLHKFGFDIPAYVDFREDNIMMFPVSSIKNLDAKSWEGLSALMQEVFQEPSRFEALTAYVIESWKEREAASAKRERVRYRDDLIVSVTPKN